MIEPLRLPGLVVLLLVGAALACPDAAEAQHHRYAAGFTLGGSHITDLNPGAAADAASVSPGAGMVFGLHADRWYGALEGRLGLRFQGTYQQPRFDWSPGERRINAGSADVSGLVRLVRPEPGVTALPYLTAGLGGIWYDLGRGDPTFFEDADAYHDGRSRVLPVVLFGAGLDVDIPWDWQGAPVRVRAELADHLAIGSPIRQASDGERYGAVHHVRLSVGLHSVFDFRP